MPAPDRQTLAAILDALDSGVMVVDRDGRILVWNDWLAAAAPPTPGPAAGRLLSEVFPGVALARLTAAVRDALELGASSLLTHQLHGELLPLKTRSGRPLIHNLSVRPIGARPYTACVVQIDDVTVVTEREQVLRTRQNARYDAVVKTAPDPIVTLDSDGLIQLANPAAEQGFGYEADELIGRRFVDRLVDRARWAALWPDLIAGRALPWPLELSVRRKDGSESFVDASASCWSNNGRPFVTAILRDVNERRAAEAQLRQLNETLESRVRARTADLERAHEQLRQSQKMEAIGQLTGGVAHDFNNLLTPIVGGLDMLQRRGSGDQRDRRLIDGALQSAERARVLVQRLLAFARRQPLKSTAVDVAGLIFDMTDLVGSTLGPRIRIAADIAKDLPRAQVDQNQLEMAVLNLAVNARDAMPDGGVLTISLRDAEVGEGARLLPGRYLRLAVTDTGIGMDAATLSKAVDPFFSTKGVGKGTGLGLSMVHGLAAQLGGALELSSTPGLGTTVEIWLPAAADGAPMAEEGPATDADPGAGVVLLVDDEDLIRATTSQMLVDLGFTVIEAASGQEALNLVGDAAIGLVVTDHLMPGMSGTEFARESQARRPRLPVLIISGYADLESIAPDLPRLMKPFRQSELAAALGALRPMSAD